MSNVAKRITLGLALTAMLVVSAVPAMAQTREDRLEDREDRLEDRFDNGFFVVDGDGFDDGFFVVDGDRFDDGFFDGDHFDDDRFGNFDGSGVSQDIEQGIDETGDVDQSFEVIGGGDDANQCVSAQGVANTGNVQDSSTFLQYASEIEDFESEDNEQSLSVAPDSSISCEQQVNQAAAAG